MLAVAVHLKLPAFKLFPGLCLKQESLIIKNRPINATAPAVTTKDNKTNGNPDLVDAETEKCVAFLGPSFKDDTPT